MVVPLGQQLCKWRTVYILTGIEPALFSMTFGSNNDNCRLVAKNRSNSVGQESRSTRLKENREREIYSLFLFVCQTVKRISICTTDYQLNEKRHRLLRSERSHEFSSSICFTVTKWSGRLTV